jgi:hypothetical protein
MGQPARMTPMQARKPKPKNRFIPSPREAHSPRGTVRFASVKGQRMAG